MIESVNCSMGRPHSSLGDQTPDQAYWALLPPMQAAA